MDGKAGIDDCLLGYEQDAQTEYSISEKQL
jgi:hypothetical protein